MREKERARAEFLSLSLALSLALFLPPSLSLSIAGNSTTGLDLLRTIDFLKVLSRTRDGGIIDERERAAQRDRASDSAQVAPTLRLRNT